MNDSDILSKKTGELHNLLTSQHTLLLATASPDGSPDLSYAPFVRDETGCFYIFISELAAHTAHIVNNPRASVMFIRPESESTNLFARERATFDCTAQEIYRNDSAFSAQLQALEDRFGEIVGLLRSLSDFRLFALSPVTGRYVAGFGQAYTIDVASGTLAPLVRKHRSV